MTTKHSLWLAIGLVMVSACRLAAGTLTNIWPFVLPSQYVVSDPTKIEVADGVAKLKLQATKLTRTSLTDYMAGTAEFAGVGLGPDISLALTIQGGQYSAVGEFESRVFDGGIANNWQALISRVQNRNIKPALGEISSLSSNIVALYHFNNNPFDEVTGTNGTLLPAGLPSGSPTFTNKSALGSAALRCAPGYFRTLNSALLHGKTDFTIMFWVNARLLDTAFQGLVTMREGANYTGFQVAGPASTTPLSVLLFIQTSSGKVQTPPSSSRLGTNTWIHIAGVRSSSGQLTLFINGVKEAETNRFPGATLVQNDYFIVGGDEYSINNYLFKGSIDEVAFFDRALSASEIREIYVRTGSVGFRVRSGTSSLLSGDYVGPDGTPSSYYIKPYESLVPTGPFDPTHRYMQYKASFLSDQLVTPVLDAVKVAGSLADGIDNTLGDFARGTYLMGITNVPQSKGTPYIRSAPPPNGGYLTVGQFTSRVLDAGSSVTWNQISWDAGTELQNSLSGLEGIWHMNENWGDESGKGHLGAPNGTGGAVFTPYAKLGTYAAVFNGFDAFVSIGSMGAPIQTVAWWMKPTQAGGNIMALSTEVGLAFSNNIIVCSGGGGAGAAVYVNGQAQPMLEPGWNHVVVTFANPLTNTDVVVGRADGRYFEGCMDELAMFSRLLPMVEIMEYYGSGRRDVAGQIRLQARADNSNPPQTPFVGVSDTISSYFVVPSGGALPASFTGKRYFQYRTYLAGDGDASPGLNSVTVQYAGASLIFDDTREEFGQGVYDSGTTEWAGDTVSLEALHATGPAALNPQTSQQLLALWPMDDSAWVPLSATVYDASGNGRNGTPVGAASLVESAQVGPRAASFGTNGYITASGGDLGNGDFSVSLWWSSTATGLCALASTYASPTTPYYALEVNPAGKPAGTVAFVLFDGSTPYRAVSLNDGLTDGNWHHVSGVKLGRRIYVYVDGRLRGSAILATGSIPLGSALVYLGKYGAQNVFFTGMMDEVAIHGRALSGVEISVIAANGFNTQGRGTYTGAIMDAGQATYWERLSWVEDAPYGKAHKPDAGSIVGLWHLDSVTNTVLGLTTLDDSGEGRDGLVEGGATVSGSGRFGACLSFSGAGQQVRIQDALELALAKYSWEAWVRLESEVNTTVLDKWSGGVGSKLGTDATGCPYFQVGAEVATAPTALRIRQWNHLAGVYDGVNVRLYVNGLLGARALAAGNDAAAVDALIGGSGLVDEVVLYNRVLNGEEILDHYRAGVNFLGFQARSWGAGLPGDFVGPDGTTNTYFTDSANTLLTGVIPLNQYFQYRATLTTEDATLTPVLRGIQVDASAYPVDNPWVAPADGFGRPFLGHLVSFMHVVATNNNDSEVKYQISGNNGTNWYAWVNSQWEDVTGYTNPVSSWNFSNFKSDIQTNIGSFYDQLYAKTGGVFKFKAFLKSDAVKQVSLDEVRLGYAGSRVVVTVPNGQEVGNEAWLEGVPYTVQWLTAGTNSTKVKLDYSLDSGQTWSNIAINVNNAVGSNSYSFWTTPPAVSDRCRVRIMDMQDGTINDTSDNDFSIVERFRVLTPNGGETWYTGRSNTVVWASALNLGLLTIDYSNSAGYIYNVAFGLPNTPGSVSNQYAWATPLGNATLLSESARILIKTLGGQGFDQSDFSFKLAGIEITNPQLGSAVKRGGTLNIRWVSAGAGADVGIDFSGDSGTNWTNVVTSSANVLGSNLFAWVSSVPPTDTAQLRIRSLSDTNVVGISAIFTLADVDVTAPSAGTTWLMNTTNTVEWTSGGAGDKVNLYWSVDSGATWVPIVSYTNSGGANSYDWLAHRFPASTARIKVESVKDPENLWAASPDFNLAGARVTIPNGGETWVKNVQSAVQWAYQSVGQKCTIQFSYDGGLSYTNVGGPGVGLSDRAYLYTPTKPTVRAKAKVVADNPAPYTNVFDESDAYFTVAGITVTAPTSGVAFTIGTSNTIAWTSAGSEDPLNQARLYYSAGPTTNLIATVGNGQSYPGGNTYLWAITPGVTPFLTARIIVQSGVYSGASDPFILRGIKFTSPVAGTVFDIGANSAVAWVYAGLDASAVGYFYLSTDGGNTFNPTPINSALNWSVQAGAYPWVISSGTDPTTNAVLKFKVSASSKPEDIGFEALSQPFTIRGFRVVTPNATTTWALGQTNQIVWLSAKGGTYASLYYATDGVTYDNARPIAANVTLDEGTNRYNWGIEAFRMPSTNARVMVVSTIASAESANFRLNGIRVTSPTASDVWAKDETNRIAWTSVGTLGTYDITLVKDGSTVVPIATGVTDPYFDWAVPLEAVSSNCYIRVQDSGGLIGRSDTFRIVGEPTIGIVSPTLGEFWKVSQTYDIQWSRGGKMENDFRVQYSTEPFIVTNEIFNGVANLDTTNNIYSIPWSVPDRLGATIIIIQNNVRLTVKDVSQPFYVVGMFTVLSPNGGETNIYALKPTTLSWFTRGTVPEVNLYYSSAFLHGPESWVRINAAPVPNNGGGLGDQLTTYDWTTVNIESTTVRIRVEQADRPGAYDDSDADFAIRYYTILWHVFDAVTSNNLDKLSVSDSSGWSASSLASPVLHRYPYGKFDTVWARQYFYNNVIFGWEAAPSRTIDVPMIRSEVEANYTVMANFVYDPSNSLFRVTSWLEQQGSVIKTASKSTVSVFDSAGAAVAQIVVTTPDANGVFWTAMPTTLSRGAVYYAKVEIELSGVVYSSGVTFNLRVPTEQEQAQLMMNALTNIQDIVSRVDTNLTDLANAQTTFRQGAMDRLNSLTNSAEVIKAGLTNLDAKIDVLSTQALARLDILTNTIGVIGPGDTNNVVAMLEGLVSAGATREARILTRPTTVKFGSTVNVLYRTKELVTVNYQVLNAGGVNAGGAPTWTGPMSGAGGIYEAALTANWGYGDYQIVCSDTAGSSDRMIIKVAAVEIDDLASSMGTVSGQLANIEFALDGMAASMSNVAEVVNTLGDLTNMTEQLAFMTNSIVQLAGLTNMPGQINSLTNTIDKLTAITNIGSQVAAMTNTMAQLAPLTNLPPQVAYLTNMVRTLSGLTNMPSQMNGVVSAINQLGSLTNLGPQVDQLAAAIGQITALTNMSGQLNTMSVTVNQLGALTNLTPKVDALTASMTEVVALTNLYSQMNGVVVAINSLGSLTNLGPQVDLLTGAMGQVAALTNMASQMNQVIAAVNSLGSLTNLGPQVDLLTGAMGQVTALTNMASQMDQVIAAVNSLGSLTNLGPQVDLLTGAMGQIVGLTNMAGQVSYLTTTLNGMTNLGVKVDQLGITLNRVATLTNMPEQVAAISSAINQLGSLTNLGSQVDLLTGAMGQIVGLTNMAGQVNYLTTTLNGMTNLPVTVESIRVGIGQLGSLTNLGGQVDALNGAMGQILSLTNMAAQVDDVVTGVAQLSGATEAMSNSIAQIYASLAILQSVSNNLDAVSSMMPLVSAMETKIGSDSDPAGSDTVFGRLYSIEENLGEVGNSASAAAKKARAAQTEAGNAASAITQVKNSVASGQIPKIMSDLAELRKALGATMTDAGGVRDSMEPDKLAKAIHDAMLKIDEMAKKQKINLGQPTEEFKPGALSDPQTVTKLMDKMAETKAMMEAMRLLMDETVNKPVVVDWLEGSQ